MHDAVLKRLSRLVELGQLDLGAYFKQCLFLGITAAAAVTAVAGTSAWASTSEQVRTSAASYSTLEETRDLARFFDTSPEAARATPIDGSTETWRGMWRQWPSMWSQMSTPE